MDVSEFKAWFEGFTAAMGGAPNGKQWKCIKVRVGQIDGTPTTSQWFHDFYWRPYYQPYQPAGAVFSDTTAGSLTVLDVTTAFTALGKAEAASIAA